VERRLAAILSADAVGYSRLMAEDEERTAGTLAACRHLISDLVGQHSGRVVDAPGDNVLAEFASVVDAVRCAVEIQQELARRNAELPAERRLLFRIGVNLGDVLVDGERILGDGVNVAARLESLAEPGGICVSGTAFDHTEGRLPFAFESTGEKQLKNIPRPVRTYRIRLDGESRPRATTRFRRAPAWVGAALIALAATGSFLWRSATPPAGPAASEERPLLAPPRGAGIAVLPFANLSGDADQEYFSDGLTEDIITGLSRFEALMVMARNSTLQYKGRAIDVREIGRELGVEYVLEGSVRRDARAIRVTAQLIDAQTGGHLWAESYDRDLTAENIFELQDEITARVVGTIADPHGVIARAGMAEARRRGTDNLQAYDCVLRSHAYEESHVAADHLRARDCLERAVELDPGYADAWAQLSYLNREEFQHGFNASPGSLDRALERARHAVELDPTNQAAYYALALAHFARREVVPFFAAADRAVELNPNNARVLGGLGVHVAFAGDWERGIELVQRGAALNPHSPGRLYLVLSSDHYRRAQYQTALEELEKTRWQGLLLTEMRRAAIHGQLGNPREARASLDNLERLDPEFALHARTELEKFYLEDALVEHFLDGLRKAGLEVPTG